MFVEVEDGKLKTISGDKDTPDSWRGHSSDDATGSPISTAVKLGTQQ
jgi:hypothetical protein